MDDPEQEGTLDIETQVKGLMEQQGFRFEKEIDGADINPPDKFILLSKYPEDEHAQQIINSLYTFIETPLVEYPGGAEDDPSIDVEDRKITEQMAEKGNEYKSEVEKLLTDNRYRVNKALLPQGNLSLIPVVFDGHTQITEAAERISEVIDKPKDYKSLSKEQKRQLIRQYTKATEVALRSLNGEQVNDDEIDQIRQFGYNSPTSQ